MSQIALGIYVQDQATHIGFVTEEGKCLGSTIHQEMDASSSLELLKACEALQKQFKVVSFHQVGIVNESSIQLNVNEISATLQAPVRVEKAGAALATYEHLWGHTQSERNFVAISIQKTLQSAAFLKGKLAMGEQGLAGDLGNLLVHYQGDTQILAHYLSETGMKNFACTIIAKSPEQSPLKNISHQALTIEHLLDAATNKDSIALRVFEQLGDILGLKLSDITNYFSPKYFILSSYHAQLSELLVKYAAPKLESSLFPVFKNKIKILISKSQETDTQVLQAASLAF